MPRIVNMTEGESCLRRRSSITAMTLRGIYHKSLHKDGKMHYTHRRLRAAMNSLNSYLPYLFTYQQADCKGMPNRDNKIDTTRMKAPAFKMILTGVGTFAYQRTDGIYVIPVGCLRE